MRANSVMRPGGKVIHHIKVYELFAMWDYKGKKESQRWTRANQARILTARLRSPLGKAVRLFLH